MECIQYPNTREEYGLSRISNIEVCDKCMVTCWLFINYLLPLYQFFTSIHLHLPSPPYILDKSHARLPATGRFTLSRGRAFGTRVPPAGEMTRDELKYHSVTHTGMAQRGWTVLLLLLLLLLLRRCWRSERMYLSRRILSAS